jgi:hypothetical protein
MNKILLYIFLFGLFLSCKNEAPTEDKSLVEKQETEKKVPTDANGAPIQSPWLATKINKESKTQQDKLDASNLKQLPAGSQSPQETATTSQGLPKLSRLISKEKIGKLAGVDATLITQKELTNKQNPDKLRSCFYKWLEPGNEDAGMFIQIQSNPIGDELPDWAKEYMKSKYQSGESMYPSDGNTYRYKKIDGIAEEAAVCHELKKVIWRPNNDMIITVVDNYRVSDKQRLKNAKEIAEVLNPQLNLK